MTFDSNGRVGQQKNLSISSMVTQESFEDYLQEKGTSYHSDFN